MPVSIAYEQLSDALSRVGRSGDAAEYHGALCGALCLVKPDDIDLMRLIEAGDAPVPNDAEARRAFVALRDETVEALQDSGMVFALLLPDDEVALVPRTRALVAWCEGFLYGLASRPGLDLKKLSEDAREIVHDLTEFTQAAVGEEEDPNIEETAYAELVEYVRVGVQLLYMELHPRPTLDPAESQHLH
ncbi:MAG: UPF0149 family protein [Solimonas sp.]